MPRGGSNGAGEPRPNAAGGTRKAGALDKAIQHLNRLIDLRRVLPGETLPPAAELARDIGVNRMAVLQAQQLLQRDGMLIVRPGRGGARVIGRDARPESERLARAIAKRQAMENMAPLREIIESGIARTVATKGLEPAPTATAHDLIARMRRVHDRDEYLKLDSEFHELLATETGSRVLQALSIGLRQLFLIGLDVLDLPDEILRASDREHARMLRAVERGQTTIAAEWAHRHSSGSMRLVAEALGWEEPIATPSANGIEEDEIESVATAQ